MLNGFSSSGDGKWIEFWIARISSQSFFVIEPDPCTWNHATLYTSIMPCKVLSAARQAWSSSESFGGFCDNKVSKKRVEPAQVCSSNWFRHVVWIDRGGLFIFHTNSKRMSPLGIGMEQCMQFTPAFLTRATADNPDWTNMPWVFGLFGMSTFLRLAGGSERSRITLTLTLVLNIIELLLQLVTRSGVFCSCSLWLFSGLITRLSSKKIVKWTQLLMKHVLLRLNVISRCSRWFP